MRRNGEAGERHGRGERNASPEDEQKNQQNLPFG